MIVYIIKSTQICRKTIKINETCGKLLESRPLYRQLYFCQDQTIKNANVNNTIDHRMKTKFLKINLRKDM